MATPHRQSRGKNSTRSRFETLQKLLAGSSGAAQSRISKPQRRPGKPTRWPPEKNDHYEGHIEGSPDGYGLADVAESTGEADARGAWETDTTVDQQPGFSHSDGMNLNDAVWSALRNLETRVQDLEASMEAQNVWNNDITRTMGNMNDANMVPKSKKATRSRRSINQEDNL